MLHEGTVAVAGQQRVPAAAPDDLDDVPAGAAEEGLELLDDLAVAADRPVEALQVAVDDERQVVQFVVGRDLQEAARLRLVHLTVAEERPDVLLAGVLDPAVVQVLVELGLVDRVHRPEAHGHGGELPERRHHPGVRVGRQRPHPSAHEVAAFLAEPVQVGVVQRPLEVRPGIHAGRGVPLEEDLVAAAHVVRPAEEVVEPDLVERRGGRIRRDVPPDPDARALGPVDHDRGVPADPAPVGLLDGFVTGEPRLGLGPDGVDVVGGRQRRHPDVGLARAFEQLEHDVARPGPPRLVDDAVEGVEPLLRLLRVRVGKLTGDSVEDRSGGVAACHVRSFLGSAGSILYPMCVPRHVHLGAVATEGSYSRVSRGCAVCTHRPADLFGHITPLGRPGLPD